MANPFHSRPLHCQNNSYITCSLQTRLLQFPLPQPPSLPAIPPPAHPKQPRTRCLSRSKTQPHHLASSIPTLAQNTPAHSLQALFHHLHPSSASAAILPFQPHQYSAAPFHPLIIPHHPSSSTSPQSQVIRPQFFPIHSSALGNSSTSTPPSRCTRSCHTIPLTPSNQSHQLPVQTQNPPILPVIPSIDHVPRPAKLHPLQPGTSPIVCLLSRLGLGSLRR